MNAWTLSTYTAAVFSSSLGSLPYRILHATPVEASLPLVVLLHGLGECGSDNTAPLIHGAADFASTQRQQKNPSFVVVPQCPAGEFWASIAETHRPTCLAAQASRPLQMVSELIEATIRAYPIDVRRIYLTGLSMGGYGTWDLLMRTPERFAAAIPICGGADCRAEYVTRIQKIPLWAFHGDRDDVVPVQRSREIIDAMRASGARPLYTEYAGGDHDSWTATYGNSEVLDWLFQQRQAEL